jgi:hypothetical protein
LQAQPAPWEKLVSRILGLAVDMIESNQYLVPSTQ